MEWETVPGKVLTLFGPSGSGKTTLLRVIAGLLRPQDGHIEIDGQVVFNSLNRVWVPPHHRRIGFLTQSYHLFPHLTVAGNIGYGLSRRDPAERQTRVQELIQGFQLSGLEERRPNQISGGQQQRAALARALAPHPALMLLDEPFSSLDEELRRNLRSELRSSLQATQVPAILVTHDIEEAISIGDAVQVINNGKVEATGSPLEVLGQPGQGRVARLVGVENLLRLRIAAVYPQDGTMVCVGSAKEGLQLEVPLSDVGDGEWVTVGIRASDIILADAEPRGSSARNRLPGIVSDIQLRPPGYEVTLTCQETDLKCHITGASLNEMGIARGDSLWAVFKASSCFLVRE
jgi:molybdenum ABC transporter ATP-binding protein